MHVAGHKFDRQVDDDGSDQSRNVAAQQQRSEAVSHRVRRQDGLINSAANRSAWLPVTKAAAITSNGSTVAQSSARGNRRDVGARPAAGNHCPSRPPAEAKNAGNARYSSVLCSTRVRLMRARTAFPFGACIAIVSLGFCIILVSTSELRIFSLELRYFPSIVRLPIPLR